ncbi:copper amine oxidase N-terminal domain-containing protein [Paenibacillus riograndensis]|uniref:Copper amine oxidase N-terminal domain protein n=1 Tax=Paenibacillus riograndensis SBR5 TaxID=1073571 RepID=A0A0E4CZS6_9BACL|nr:copper amine oxidase N-terminal domain-containing protein [Paenibacillus riograndensis]CQR58857.1 copper amine oxidase N-terminal domain protein [Paenibacillus riograndensis SBR5]
MNAALKTSAILLTLSLALTTGGVSAAPSAASTPNHSTIQTPSAGAATFSISVNGSALSEPGFQSPGSKEPLLPLRAVAGALGFTVAWNAQTKAVDLNKGSIFTSVKSGKDRYAVNKMYIQLGTAPQTKQNKLYVPASFVSKVLRQSVSAEGQRIEINPAAEHISETGVITAITDADSYQSVRIRGIGTEGMILNVGKDTRLNRQDGSELAFSELHIGMTVEAQHSLISTRSLPPQTPAYQITVLDGETQDDLLGTAGTVQQVTTAEDGTVSFRIRGSALSEKSQNEVVLRLAKDTVVINENGETASPADVIQGAEVISFYSPLLTRSLPPSGTALKVVLKADKL